MIDANYGCEGEGEGGGGAANESNIPCSVFFQSLSSSLSHAWTGYDKYSLVQKEKSTFGLIPSFLLICFFSSCKFDLIPVDLDCSYKSNNIIPLSISRIRLPESFLN